MAFSGTSGAYYRSNAASTTGDGLHNAYTRHWFVRASAAPSTANLKFAGGMVGDGVALGGAQRPQDHMAWNHTSSSFYGSNYHRTLADAYHRGQMTIANLTADTWHSIGAVFNGSTIQSYLNGTADGSEATSAARGNAVFFDALAGITTAGGLDGSSQFSNGQLAEFAVWNVALTADEITSLSKGFRARLIRPQSLVFYAPMVRERVDIRGGRTLSLLAGTEVISDHPRIIG